MKLRRGVIAVPTLAVAVASLLLGAMAALRFFGSAPGHGSIAQFFAQNTLSSAVIGLAALIVIGIALLKNDADRRLQIDRQLLENFLEHIPDHVFFKDRASRFVRVSCGLARHFGLSDPVQAKGKTDADFFSAEHANQALADEQEILHTGEPMIAKEEKETWPDGREGWVLTTKVPLKDQRGRVIGTMGIARNITDRKQAEARIRHMALHDPLTGLANRTHLLDRLGQAIALAQRNQREVGVIMLDLDHFKNINDSCGHYAGDRLLEAVAARLRECLRESDLVSRLGGDEFVIMLPMLAEDSEAENVAGRVLAILSEPIAIEGQKLHTAASLGICRYPADGENPEELLQAADAAMYEAKHRGRGIYVHFTSSLSQATRNRLELQQDLGRALERGEFLLMYQPLVSADFHRVTGVEALLRWRHPQHGLIPPHQFIPHLEKLGQMLSVGRWVLMTACRQNAEWHRQGLLPVPICVNLSAQEFYRGGIVNTVKEILRETALEPKWLELELTEAVAFGDPLEMIRIMRELKEVGVGISLDDFGTGWPFLSLMQRFPLDRIKIDRSFTRDVPSQPNAEAVVKSILTLAREMGVTCIAEGVETQQQLEYLQKQMCPEVQGFVFSPALPDEEFASLLRSENPEKFVHWAAGVPS